VGKIVKKWKETKEEPDRLDQTRLDSIRLIGCWGLKDDDKRGIL